MKKLALLSVFALSTVGAHAQVSGVGDGALQPGTPARLPAPAVQFVTYREIPGVQEFTGRMIAKPRDTEEWRLMGYSFLFAEGAKGNAVNGLQPYLLFRLSPTDNYVIDVPDGMDENAFSRQLMATGLYSYVEPDWEVFPQQTQVPNDPHYPNQWHLGGTWGVLAPQGWGLFTGNQSTVVAIADTGLRLDHEDYVNAFGQTMLVPGANTATGSAIAQTTNDSTSNVWDINGHGTHCAGIAAAGGNNGRGVSGAAWNLRIMPVRVSNSTGGGSSISALQAAALWASDPLRGSTRARVVSTSYSGFTTASNETVGLTLANRDSLWFWAAGNSNADSGTASLPNVIAVGSTDSGGGKSSFSNFGTTIDVWAGGSIIRATYNSSPTSYADLSGTSMACPLAAGVTALLLNSNPAITAVQARDIIQETNGVNTLARTLTHNGVTRPRAEINPTLRYAYATFPFWADSASNTVGATRAGSVLNTRTSDNVDLVLNTGSRSAGKSQVQIQSVVEATTTLRQVAVANVDVQVESAVSGANVNVTVEMWNWTTSTWAPIGAVLTVQSTDTVQTFSPASSDGQFVSTAGLMRARLNYSYAANAPANPFNIEIDRVGFLTTP